MAHHDKSPTSLDAVSAASRIEGRVNVRARRLAYCFAFLFIGICIFVLPLKDLMVLSLKSHFYDYIPVMFIATGYLLVSERKKIFDNVCYSLGYGVPVLVLSLIASVSGLKYAPLLTPNDYLCIMIFSFWLFLMGTFILFFGARAFRKAIFPLALLLFTIPLPTLVFDKVVDLLQAGSYASAGWIFNTLGFFPIKHGFTFTFPEISIKVARECSGIHSCTALVILALLCGHFFLRSKLNRALLVVFAIAIAIFKNGVRIAALTLAAIYIDPHILATYWHRDGGILIFGFAFAWLALVVFVMRWLEKRRRGKPALTADESAGDAAH